MTVPGRKGAALVVCAPSGTGKTTLVRRLAGEFPNFAYSVSYTTRKPRQGEVNGRDYHFVDRAEFDGLVERNFFAEWAEVHGQRYGTPLQPVLDSLEAGKDVLFDIDVQGAAQLRDKIPAVHVFILPPSREELRRRLVGRGLDSAEVVETRMANAAGEIARAGDFDAWIVNDDLDLAYDMLRSLFLAATLAPDRRPGLLEELMAQWEE